MNREISIVLVEQELKEIWEGSGHSLKSIAKYLRDDLHLAWDSVVWDHTSLPYTYFGNFIEGYFVFVLDMSGYEILQPYKGHK